MRTRKQASFKHLAGLAIKIKPVASLLPTSGNPRIHTVAQVSKIAASIAEFGFNNPILIDEKKRIVAGHGRLEVARMLGIAKVPTIQIDHLTQAQKRAYIIADNRIAERAGWDRELLAIELKSLSRLEIEFDLEITGFETEEIDFLLEGNGSKSESAEDEIPQIDATEPAVSRAGDIWCLGDQRLAVGNSLDKSVLFDLMMNEKADAVFTDPPYNVKIDGNARGQGRVRHREFAMASGEMSQIEFIQFLQSALQNFSSHSRDGSIAFVCMDWRHIDQLLAAGRQTYSELKNIAIWVKGNAGMGSFYRSQHELIAVFKKGTGPHQNNFGLGGTGRYRTNVWQYNGVNSFKAHREEELRIHPTVKPVALIADAIKDVTRRGQIVLDGFLGSGSTLIAAEKTGRRCRGVEIDPHYADTTIERWQRLAGAKARHLQSNKKLHRNPVATEPSNAQYRPPYSEESLTMTVGRKPRTGYRQPPVESRFKKGRSGNPRGRPKGVKNFSSLMAELLKQRVTVTERGRRRSIPAIEALLKRILTHALQGDSKASHQILNLFLNHSSGDDAGQINTPSLEDDSEIIHRTLDRLMRERNREK